VYKRIESGNYQLYCYNGRYWENDDVLLRIYISTELYEYYKDLCVDVYWNARNFTTLKSQVDGLKRLAMKRNIVELYKEHGVRNIQFDEKWHLLGFNNMVYDLITHRFREYREDDYISTTTGYDWVTPTYAELATMESLIEKIMPIKEERIFYKAVLSTALEGRCLEKFIIFNGSGGNGKGMIDEMLLLALGQHAITANNSILFEKGKTGSNPEKANLHKKRLVIFKELPANSKFENSIVKELTGGGLFSARSHHEKKTEKRLHSTIICECNKRPLFVEEPKDAEIRRLIDILFRSKFTDNTKILDDKQFIFQADDKLKNLDFQNDHRCALLQILMDAHQVYAENNYKLDNMMPPSIKKRTAEYLESNCDLLQWFKRGYKLTNNKKDYIRLKDVYNQLKQDEYYSNMSRLDRQKHTYNFFVEYFFGNIVTKKYYKERAVGQRNVLTCWKKIKKDDNVNEAYEFVDDNSSNDSDLDDIDDIDDLDDL